MYTSDKDKLFCSKLEDAVGLCFVRQKPYFFSFLSQRRQALAEAYLRSVSFQNFEFFGGYPDSERKILGLFFDCVNLIDFPVSAIQFKFRPCDKLTHRDFLGAMMSLGVERDTIGDILVEDGRAVVFVKSELSDYFKTQLTKIGRVGVSVSDAILSDLPSGRGTQRSFYTVSSLRLDNIVAAITGQSREKTKALILSGGVTHNFVTRQNISEPLSVSDTVTIKGKGKFVLDELCGNTKKGRIRISIIHYR